MKTAEVFLLLKFPMLEKQLIFFLVLAYLTVRYLNIEEKNCKRVFKL